MSTDGQGTKRQRKIAENFNRLIRVHERYRQTDGRAIAIANVSSHSQKNEYNNFVIFSNITHTAFYSFTTGRMHVTHITFWLLMGRVWVFLPLGCYMFHDGKIWHSWLCYFLLNFQHLLEAKPYVGMTGTTSSITLPSLVGLGLRTPPKVKKVQNSAYPRCNKGY